MISERSSEGRNNVAREGMLMGRTHPKKTRAESINCCFPWGLLLRIILDTSLKNPAQVNVTYLCLILSNASTSDAEPMPIKPAELEKALEGKGKGKASPSQKGKGKVPNHTILPRSDYSVGMHTAHNKFSCLALQVPTFQNAFEQMCPVH